ncbi:hypothetical protein BMS3Bbin04_01823 [bacterium BMS3Bbin04]|nr:hypothetical protein BMS3Bbin04_01823 [bacterium BMS3Bbin04]
MTPRLGGLTISIVLLLGFSSFVLAQYEEVKPKEVYAVKISDAEVIETFRRGQLISPTIAIDSVEFIDVTRNGFGQGDLMIIYPQERVFPLLEINETERSILNLYQFEENKTYSAPSIDVTQIQEDARILESPFAGILSTVIKGVQYYYDGNYIQGIFRMDRERDLATLTLWNYETEGMVYQQGSPSGIADTMLNYDLLKVYIRELTTDTVFVPILVTEDQLEARPFAGVGNPLYPVEEADSSDVISGDLQAGPIEAGLISDFENSDQPAPVGAAIPDTTITDPDGGEGEPAE